MGKTVVEQSNVDELYYKICEAEKVDNLDKETFEEIFQEVFAIHLDIPEKENE